MSFSFGIPIATYSYPLVVMMVGQCLRSFYQPFLTRFFFIKNTNITINILVGKLEGISGESRQKDEMCRQKDEMLKCTTTLQPWTFFLTGSLVLTGSYKLAGLKADRSQGKWQVYGDYFKKNFVFRKVTFSTFCSYFCSTLLNISGCMGQCLPLFFKLM